MYSSCSAGRYPGGSLISSKLTTLRTAFGGLLGIALPILFGLSGFGFFGGAGATTAAGGGGAFSGGAAGAGFTTGAVALTTTGAVAFTGLAASVFGAALVGVRWLLALILDVAFAGFVAAALALAGLATGFFNAALVGALFFLLTAAFLPATFFLTGIAGFFNALAFGFATRSILRSIFHLPMQAIIV